MLNLSVAIVTNPILDIVAVQRFFQLMIEKRERSEKRVLDRSAASQTAVAGLQQEVRLLTDLTVRTNGYLNNLIKQDHRCVKQRVRPMRGFKQFEQDEVTPAGFESVHQIKKHPFGEQQRSGGLDERKGMRE